MRGKKTTTWPGNIMAVSICCSVLLFEITPTTSIISTAVGPVYSNISTIDNTATFMKGILQYQTKYLDEHNIGHVSDIALSVFSDSNSKSQRRTRTNNFENNGNEDSLHYQSTRGANRNTITERRGGSSGRGSSKLVHSSFRVEQHVIKSLEQVAARRDMSLSAIVNKILKNYITSEMYFEELGFLLVSKNFLRRTFEALDQKSIADLGREYGLTIAKEYVSYFYPQVNNDTLIQFLEIWFRRFQSCQHRVDEADHSIHYFTINHDINMNFTLAMQSILEGLIEPIIMSTVEFTNITPSAITFFFKLGKHSILY